MGDERGPVKVWDAFARAARSTVRHASAIARRVLNRSVVVKSGVLALLASRVVFWLSPGYSPDGGNSYSMLMPAHANPMALMYPWVSYVDNGYANPSIPGPLNNLIAYTYGYTGIGTWGAQIAWLFTLYFVGSLLVALLFDQLFRGSGSGWWAGILAGCAYQLSPSLIYGLQDTAAYGLVIGYYWGIPLFLLVAVAYARRPSRWHPPVMGGASLLLLMAFPAVLGILPIVLILGAVLMMECSPEGRGLRQLAKFAVATVPWALLANLWWLIPQGMEAGQLTQNLQSNTPLTSSPSTNYFFYVLTQNSSLPPHPAYLSYVGGSVFETALVAMTCVSVLSLLERRFRPVVPTLFAFFLLLTILISGYGWPFGDYYLYVVNSSYVFYLVRNTLRFTYVYMLLAALLFAAGADWAARRVSWPRTQRTIDRTTAAHPRRRARFPGHTARGRLYSASAVVIACVCILALGGLPLLTGSVLVDTYYTGTALEPYSPSHNGVRVPEYYSQARDWMSANYPDATTIVFPEPDTWLSDQSGLSWQYEGSGGIYNSLLAPPLILNDAGTLASLGYQAISDIYAMASDGGPPINETLTPLNGTVSLWSGYANDSVAEAGTSLSSEHLDWNVDVSQEYGGSGHQFEIAIPHPSKLTTYLSLTVQSTVAGSFAYSWLVNGSYIGWYFFHLTPGKLETILLDVNNPPPINYNPSYLTTSSFYMANQLAFKFVGQPGSGSPTRGTLTISNVSTFCSSAPGMMYYLRSLGITLVAYDKSIIGSPVDPLQNFSTYLPALTHMGIAPIASFGNLSFYAVASPLPLFECVDNWTLASAYWSAWTQAGIGDSYFVDGPLSWLPSRLSGCSFTTDFHEVGPNSYTATLTTSSPTSVVFLQNFNPLWELTVNGVTDGSHFVANGFANGWLINSTGIVTIRLSFGPSIVFTLLVDATVAVGILAISGVVAWPLIVSRLRERRRRP